jgi:cytochrome P450
MVLADFIPSFNLFNLSISVAIIMVTAFVVRLAGYAKVFIDEIPDYKHLPHHKSWWAIKELYDQKGGFDSSFVEGMKKDGTETFEPVVNLGPWGNGKTYVGVTDADAFRQILPDINAFPKLPATYAWFSNLVGNGLLVASGEPWRIQRKRVTPLFHLAILKRSVPVMVDITKELLKFLKDKTNDYHSAKSLFALHTMRVIVHLAFGGDFDPEWMLNAWERVEHAFNDWTWGWCVFGDIWNYLPIPAAAGFRKARMAIRDRLAEAIDARRIKLEAMVEAGEELDEADHNNLLYCLLGSTNVNGEVFTTEEIVDQSITFLFAGHDTSSVALAWSFYYMAKHPDCLQKLREEADRVLGDRDPTPEDLNELTYAKNFMREVLRLRPPVPIIDRITTSDVEIAGTKLKEGTYMGLMLCAVARDSRYYKDPNEFIPDRWLDEKTPDPFSNLPFGSGPRICVGSRFAQQEITIALSMISRELDVAHDPNSKISAAFEGVVTPKGLKLKFSPRVRV